MLRLRWPFDDGGVGLLATRRVTLGCEFLGQVFPTNAARLALGHTPMRSRQGTTAITSSG